MASFSDGVWFFDSKEVEVSSFEDYVDIDLFDDSNLDEEMPNRKVRVTIARADARALAAELLRCAEAEMG